VPPRAARACTHSFALAPRRAHTTTRRRRRDGHARQAVRRRGRRLRDGHVHRARAAAARRQRAVHNARPGEVSRGARRDDCLLSSRQARPAGVRRRGRDGA
jgi:hypothetical protein